MKKVLMIAAKANMIQQFNKRNIKILQNIGVEVHVGTNFKEYGSMDNKENEKLKKWLDENSVIQHQLDFERGLGNFKSNFKVISQIEEILINSDEWEFVHVHSPIGSVLGRIAAYKRGVKSIYTAHGFHFFRKGPIKNWIFFPVEWILALITKELIVINKEDLNISKYMPVKQVTYIPSVGVEVQKMKVVPDFEKDKIKKEIRQAIDIQEDDYVILNVGELSNRKNQIVILKALSLCNNPKIKFIVAGVGPNLEYYKKVAKKLNIESQVKFLGYRNDIQDLHFASDVFIFPSLREGFGLGGFEAIVDGLPVLGSQGTGIADYIVNGENGLLINPTDEVNLADKLNKIVNKQIKFKKSTFEEVMNFDISKVDKIMEDVYLRNITIKEVVGEYE